MSSSYSGFENWDFHYVKLNLPTVQYQIQKGFYRCKTVYCLTQQWLHAGSI